MISQKQRALFYFQILFIWQDEMYKVKQCGCIVLLKTDHLFHF